MIADDKKTLVASGYDEIVDAYIDRFGRSSVRATKLAEVVAHLSAGASVLDLGCGPAFRLPETLRVKAST
jgi:cyclopropane fatty-acyl-phospholipid synthase-like methyltransferase